MNKESSTDVVICGAGAAGLTLAIELARRGVAFRLIDKAQDAFRGSRGKGLQPRTLEVFEDLGIVNQVVASGGLYPPQREYASDGTFNEAPVAERVEPTPGEPYQQPMLVPQFLTEKVMRERLLELGHRPEFACELMELQQAEAGVTARVKSQAGEEFIRARYLIGADGGRSFVRHALNIEFPGKTLGVRSVAADVALSGLGREAWHRYHEGDMQRQLALCPLVGTDLFQIQAPIPLEGDIDLSPEGLTRFVTERSGRADLHVDRVSWASAFHMNARLAERYRVGHVFLVGDAAHVHPPTGGQGLNTSVQDAYNLGWKLAAVLKGAPDTLLDSYHEERRPIAESVLGLSTQLLDAMKQGNARRGRDVRQLDLGYRQSSLTLESSKRAQGLPAGDRAPDGLVRGRAGQTMRLFELFRGAHWTLLGYEVPRDAVKPRPGVRTHAIGAGGDLVDEYRHFRDAYAAAPGTWILVRPDKYVGAIVAADEAAALESYLSKVGLGYSGERAP